jgi:hypothetical protein
MTNIVLDHDFSDFDPEGFSYPPAGFYTLVVTNAESKTKSPEKGGYTFITLTFKVAEGEQAGQQFLMDYLTGFPKERSEKTAKIAMENLGRIYYGATGIKPGRDGLKIAEMLNKPLQANLIIEEKPKTDGSGGTFKNAKLNGIQIAGTVSAQPATAETKPAAAETKPAWG